MDWGDTPGIYFVKLECPDRRWWHGEIVASSRDEAIATARVASGLADAPLVACDRANGRVVPEVRHSAIVTPRGWEAPKEAP